MTVGEHESLLEMIKQCSGKVMISGYDSALYRKGLADWNVHSFDLPNNAATGPTKARKTEVVWCNF
jgi:DNA adenine methylase